MRRREVPRTPRILLIEDNEGDARLTEEAVHQADPEIEVLHAKDSETAMERLDEAEPGSLPDLILMDLSVADGPENSLLTEIKAHEGYHRIPVVVLTGSEDEAAMTRAYDEGANGYVVKPGDLDGFMDQMATLVSFWFDVVRLPANDPR